MKRLLFRGLLLAAPFLLLSVFVVVVDPYDYLAVSRAVSDDAKKVTAAKLHYSLWKVQKFREAPTGFVLLGDSRMDAVSAAAVSEVTGHRYFNFAYGGGTLAEALDTYWLAADTIKLEEVYFEIGFVNFNGSQTLNRVPEAKTVLGNPLLYVTNRTVLEGAFLAAYVQLTGRRVNIETPSMDHESFWRFQIEDSTTQVLRGYSYPTAYAGELQRLAADCRRRGTRLVIVIPPTHVDLQKKIAALGFSADQERFRAFVATLGPVFDFDYSNEYTEARENFSDPYHPTSTAQVIQEVWGHQIRYAHYSAGER
jgi:hypothetical protein